MSSRLNATELIAKCQRSSHITNTCPDAHCTASIAPWGKLHRSNKIHPNTGCAGTLRLPLLLRRHLVALPPSATLRSAPSRNIINRPQRCSCRYNIAAARCSCNTVHCILKTTTTAHHGALNAAQYITTTTHCAHSITVRIPAAAADDELITLQLLL